MTAPHPYDHPTRQLAVRCQQKNGQWHHAVLVFNLVDDALRWLLQRRYAPENLPTDTIWLAVYAYDQQGGAAETTFKGSKSGLGISKRNKKRTTIKDNRHLSAGQLIAILNPIIRGWANYHCHVASKKTFIRVEKLIFQVIWHWTRRKHLRKSAAWV